MSLSIPPPCRPERQYADPLLPIPDRIDDIIKMGRRSDVIHFVLHGGYITVWGRAAHYVGPVCGIRVVYREGHAVVAWESKYHNKFLSMIETDLKRTFEEN